MSAASPTAPAAPFPTDDSLCESCGYSLRGLAGSEKCPECGTPLAESDPARRTGLPWQNKMSVGSWLKTTWMMVRRPRRAFRVMRVTRTAQLVDWVYVLITGALAGLLVPITGWIVGFRDTVGVQSVSTVPRAIREAEFWFGTVGGSMMLVSVLALVEAAGVTWVSRRRGWRVPLPLALQVTWYAGLGWLIAAVIFSTLVSLVTSVRWISELVYVRGDLVRFFVGFTTIVVMSILWFETLVWLGVRQVRYANFAGPAGADLTR